VLRYQVIPFGQVLEGLAVRQVEHQDEPVRLPLTSYKLVVFLTYINYLATN
jgi:hypothetical protein